MLASACWRGRLLAIDLPGHGACARARAHLIAAEAHGAPVKLLGHSLGGIIALALASGQYGFAAAHAYALGVKMDWSSEALDRSRTIAARPPRCFDDLAAATAQHGRLVGLDDTAIDSPLLACGARRKEGRGRTSVDMAAFAIEPPAMDRLVGEASCLVALACGDGVNMLSIDRLREFDSSAVLVADAGHNLMIDYPDEFLHWVGGSRADITYDG